MRPKLRHALPELYEGARRYGRSLAGRRAGSGARLPKECPYDWAAVTERDVMAEIGIDLAGGEDTAKPRRKRKA